MAEQQLLQLWLAQIPQMPEQARQRGCALLRRMRSLQDRLESLGFIGWVEDLMQLPRAVRKERSYDGAMRCQGQDRVDWTDPTTGTQYWDAGNYIYARALHLAMCYRPHTFDMPWNEETLGDIVECALAQAWHFPNDPYWRDIQAALEDMVRVTDDLCSSLLQPHHGGAQQFAEAVDDLFILMHRHLHVDDLVQPPPQAVEV